MPEHEAVWGSHGQGCGDHMLQAEYAVGGNTPASTSHSRCMRICLLMLVILHGSINCAIHAMSITFFHHTAVIGMWS